MTVRKLVKFQSKPILRARISGPNRDILVGIASIILFIFFYGLIFNTETALNMLKPASSSDFWNIFAIIILIIGCINIVRKLIGPDQIIINELGLSCVSWSFTLLGWETIDYVTDGKLKVGEQSIPVLKIYLNEPLNKSVLLYHHSIFMRIFLRGHRGNGMKFVPIILDMRGLNKDVSDVIDFLTIHYPEKVIEN